MSFIVFANNAASNLAAPLSPTSTSLTVTSGTGALFPALSAGQYFTLTLLDALTKLVTEIVYVIARSVDTMTVTRGQEGTTAVSWLAGDFATNECTAGTMAAFPQLGAPNTWTAVNTFDDQPVVPIATNPNAPVSLTQFSKFGNAFNSGSPNLSTSISFTAPCDGVLIATGAAGQFTGEFTTISYSIAFSSGSVAVVGSYGNTSAGAPSNLASNGIVVSFTFGSFVTLTLTMTGTGSSSFTNIGFNYFIVPTA